METKKLTVGVIGAGVMGAGLIQLLATSACIDKVYWISARGHNLDLPKKKLLDEVDKLVRKGRLDSELGAGAHEKIIITQNLETLRGCEIIHEAVSEDVNEKRKVLNEMSKIVSENTIIASNTSSISITELAMSIAHPSRLIGMHFFNPAPLMRLVELVNGYYTSADTEKKIKEYSEYLAKLPVIVADAPGFIVNRMLMPMINEAVCILADNVADRESIDKAMKFGANHPIGPLALADMIGNDVVLSIMQVLYDETGDQKYRPHPFLKKMVRAGRLGKKTKTGFYDY